MTTKTYNLTPMKQLIDLNGDLVNFDLTFTATTKDGSPFDILVVDQTTLDSNPVLDYKKANGTMSGNIIADKGVYQNYFLILKSDNPSECDVTIDIKEIPKREQIQNFQHPLQNINQLKKPTTRINWFIVLVVIIACLLLFYYFYGNKKSNDINLEKSTLPLSPSPKLDSTNNIDLSSNFKNNLSSNKIQPSLLDKLNKLNIRD